MCSTKLGRIKIIHFCFLNCLTASNKSTKKSNTVHLSRNYVTLAMEPHFCVFDMSQS